MLSVVEKLRKSLWGKLWESCGKVLHILWFSLVIRSICVKVEKFSRSISTSFSNNLPLFNGRFYTFST